MDDEYLVVLEENHPAEEFFVIDLTITVYVKSKRVYQFNVLRFVPNQE